MPTVLVSHTNSHSPLSDKLIRHSVTLKTSNLLLIIKAGGSWASRQWCPRNSSHSIQPPLQRQSTRHWSRNKSDITPRMECNPRRRSKLINNMVTGRARIKARSLFKDATFNKMVATAISFKPTLSSRFAPEAWTSPEAHTIKMVLCFLIRTSSSNNQALKKKWNKASHHQWKISKMEKLRIWIQPGQERMDQREDK